MSDRLELLEKLCAEHELYSQKELKPERLTPELKCTVCDGRYVTLYERCRSAKQPFWSLPKPTVAIVQELNNLRKELQALEQSNCKATCHPTFRRRDNETEFNICPNAFIASVSEFIEDCSCAESAGIMLCNNASHWHSRKGPIACLAEMPAVDQFRDRLLFGVNNQNIVLMAPFAQNSLKKWHNISSRLHSPYFCANHGDVLCEQFNSEMQKNQELEGLRYCLYSFLNLSVQQSETGKVGDSSASLLPATIKHLISKKTMRKGGKSCRDAGFIDQTHPRRSRVSANRGATLGVAILFFFVATQSHAWQSVWSLWKNVILNHRCSLNCHSSVAEAFAFLYLCVSCFDDPNPIIRRETVDLLNQLLN